MAGKEGVSRLRLDPAFLDELNRAIDRLGRTVDKAARTGEKAAAGSGGVYPDWVYGGRAGGSGGTRGAAPGPFEGFGDRAGGPPPRQGVFGTGLRTLGERYGVLNPGGGLSTLGMVGLATGGARTSLNAAAATSNYANDRYGNETSLHRQLIRDLVPFGGTVQSYHDQISGRAARMRALGEDEQLAGIDTQTSIGLAAYRYGAGREQSSRSIRADVLGGSQAVVMGRYDRSTAEGEQDYRQQRLLLPLRQQSARADREASIATKERLAAEKQLVGIDNESVRLHQRRAALAAQLAGTADNEKKKDISGRIGQADRQLQANTALRQEAAQGVAGARANEATAAGAADMARIGVGRGEAEILRDKAERARGAAITLGGMDRHERAYTVRNAEGVVSRGLERSLPDQIEEARRIIPRKIQEMELARGKGGPEMARVRELSPADAPGDVDELEGQAAGMERRADRAELAAEAKLARGVRDAFGPVIDMVVKLMKETGAQQAKELEDKFRSQRIE